MADFVTLTCPSCGGKLVITPDIDRFACTNCGNEHIVIRQQGIVSIKPVIEELKQVHKSIDKTASELAIPRLLRELETLHEQKKQVPSGTYFIFLSIFFTLLFILVSVSFVRTENWILLICSIFFACLVVVFVTMFRKTEREKQERINKINKLMADKEKEYKYHLQIVNTK